MHWRVKLNRKREREYFRPFDEIEIARRAFEALDAGKQPIDTRRKKRKGLPTKGAPTILTE